MARRARELGFATTVGIVHDGQGQLRPLGPREQQVYHEIVQLGGKSFTSFAYYNQFQKNLIQGKPNDWHCRAGSRYLYICEDGLVHYCCQQGGTPGVPLEQYNVQNLEHEFQTIKLCAPLCTISCVHQVSMIAVPGVSSGVAESILSLTIRARRAVRCDWLNPHARVDVSATGREQCSQKGDTVPHAGCVVVSEGKMTPPCRGECDRNTHRFIELWVV